MTHVPSLQAKLIGVEPVTAPRGDKMCKAAMARLKAVVKGTGAHKQRVRLTVSLDGLKLFDEPTGELLSAHPIPLIRFAEHAIAVAAITDRSAVSAATYHGTRPTTERSASCTARLRTATGSWA